MSDLYFNESGDVQRSSNGDFAITSTTWRDDVQQAYIRIMTEEEDYVLYPALGATLSKLWGLPQSPETAKIGIDLITAALDREGRFQGKPFLVEAVPTGFQTIRFDVTMVSGSREQIVLSVEQNLEIGA